VAAGISARGIADSRRWAAAYAAAGGLALAVQVTLLREYLVTLQGDEAAVGLGLAAWLVGIGIGAGLSRLASARQARHLAAWALGLLALSGMGGLCLARTGRQLFATPPGELLTLGPSLLLGLLVFTLPGALIGTAFVALATATAHFGSNPDQSIGKLYVFEALGSLGAGLLVTLVVIPRIPSVAGLSLMTSVTLAAAVPAALAGLIGGRWLVPLLSAAALLGALPVTSEKLELYTEQLRFASLAPNQPFIASTETPYQQLTIGGDEVRVLYASGQYVTSFPDPFEDESRAHQLMLLAERPQRVLAFGGVETGLLRFCLMHPVQQFDLVIMDQRAFELVERYLAPPDRAALSDPRVRVTFDDPRRFLERSRDNYDLVLNLAPDPETLLVARTATVQWNRRVASRLAPGGVYVSRFTTGANVQAGEIGALGASLYNSLRDVFPVVEAAPGPDGLLLAGESHEAVTLDPTRLAARWNRRGIESEVFVAELLPMLFPEERVATLRAELDQQAIRAPSTTDDRPVSLHHALLVRQQIAQSAWATMLGWSARHPRWLLVLSLLPSALFFAWRLARRRRALASVSAHAIAVTGGCGLAWSLMLFFSFQTRVGALYSGLGALTAVYMLGLAGGGFWATRRGAGTIGLLRAQGLGLGFAIAVTLGLAGMDRLERLPWLLLAAHVVLLALAGAATGALFPAAASALGADASRTRPVASLLELTDHGGAAVAALGVAVVFVPAFGLAQTAAITVALQLLALGATWIGVNAQRE